jgi:hypothetical protein
MWEFSLIQLLTFYSRLLIDIHLIKNLVFKSIYKIYSYI